MVEILSTYSEPKRTSRAFKMMTPDANIYLALREVKNKCVLLSEKYGSDDVKKVIDQIIAEIDLQLRSLYRIK